jgi:3-methyladenine DNA glycosylase AlkD
MNPYSQQITEVLLQKSSPDKAEWWNRYMKGSIPFLGAGLPEIRKYLLDINDREGLDSLPLNRQVGLVKSLIRGAYAEEKLAAILFVQLFWLGKQKHTFILDLLTDWFDERHIFDWNTTDWLCVKVLGPMIDGGGEQLFWTLKYWNRDPYLWKARASLVPFSQSSDLTRHAQVVDTFSDMLIRRKERFAKTAVGWVLREYSKKDPQFVLDFLSRHAAYLTSEVKRNALKYYRKQVRG